MLINFIFPINFGENNTKNSREYRKEKNKIALNKYKFKTYQINYQYYKYTLHASYTQVPLGLL